jgi:hypothetical protein
MFNIAGNVRHPLLIFMVIACHFNPIIVLFFPLLGYIFYMVSESSLNVADLTYPVRHLQRGSAWSGLTTGGPNLPQRLGFKEFEKS